MRSSTRMFYVLLIVVTFSVIGGIDNLARADSLNHLSDVKHTSPQETTQKTSDTISISLYTLRETSNLIQVLLAIVFNLLLSTHMTTIGITVACRQDG